LIFKILLTIILLITFVFLINNYDVSAQEIDLECPKNEVVVVRTTNPNPICVDKSTAERWIELGIVETVGELIEEETEETVPEIEESPEETIPEFQYPSIPNDLSRAQSYLVTISGGELTEPITFQTFSKIEPGDQPNYISSFYDLGFDTYFSLDSFQGK